MAEDEWSALDEELEKALSSKKGKKGKRDSVLFTKADAIDAASSAKRSETATLSRGKKTHDDPAVSSSTSGPPVTAAPASAPGEALDEWSALDEELAKLEQGKKRRGKNDGGGGGGGGGGAAHRVSSTEPKAAPKAAPPATLSANTNTQHEHHERRREERCDVPSTVPVPAPRLESAAESSSSFEPDDASHGRFVSAHIVGTCDDMCPERERVFRERERELDVYERVETSTFSQVSENANAKTGPAPATSASLCVKRFARIVDHPSPDTVRTRSALERTTRHLYSLLGGRADAPPTEWETLVASERDSHKKLDAKDASESASERSAANDKNTRARTVSEPSPLSLRAGFLWDRLRGVRQDAALQNWCDSWMVARLEEMVRFAIATEYLLCEDRERSSRGRATHDSHLHREQLNKTLATLTRLYRDARRDVRVDRREGEREREGDESSSSFVFPNEPEMLCYQLLLSMGAESVFSSFGFGTHASSTESASNGERVGLRFTRLLRGAPITVSASKEIQFALRVFRARDSGNACAFFKLIESKACSYLQACCLYTQLNCARTHALLVASQTWNKSADADLFRDVGVDLLRLDLRFGVDKNKDEDEDKHVFVKKVVSSPARACVTAAAAAMMRACGLAVDEAAGTAAPRASPFVDPETKKKTQKKDANVFDDDAFRPRRERVVDAKAPAAKGGFFRWRALIEGKAGR